MLRVKKWSTYQHYTKRNPPWVKLHRKLLDNKDWYKLSYASRSLAIFLWLLASEEKTGEPGTVMLNHDEIAFRVRMKDVEVVDCIKELIKHDFIEFIEEKEPDLLAPRYQSATPESETREQRQKDQRKNSGKSVDKPVDSGDKSAGLLKTGKVVLGQGVRAYDVRDFFTELEFNEICLVMRNLVNAAWDRRVVFEKYNNFAKSDPPKKPAKAFLGWLEASTWLRKAP